MIIDGEVYACETCVRGHRVGNCQHHDRPLQPIKKKGRPASQCEHCRALRKTRSAHVKCSCGKKADRSLRDQKSIEGDEEGCQCMYGGRCICAHKKESLQLGNIPRSEFGESSSISGQSSSGLVNSPESNTNAVHPPSLPTLDEHDHCNPELVNTDAPQTRRDYGLNYEHSLHSMTSLDSGSVHNFTHTGIGQSRSGSSAVLGTHQEQGQVTLGTNTPDLLNSNTSAAFQQPDIRLSLLDGSNMDYAARANFQLFDDLPDVTQGVLGSELSAANGNSTNYDLGWASSHNQVQGLSATDFDWFAQPSNDLTTIFPSAWGGVPELGSFGTSAEALQHSIALLPDPILHGSSATIPFPESERRGQPGPANGQDKLS